MAVVFRCCLFHQKMPASASGIWCDRYLISKYWLSTSIKCKFLQLILKLSVLPKLHYKVLLGFSKWTPKLLNCSVSWSQCNSLTFSNFGESKPTWFSFLFKPVLAMYCIGKLSTILSVLLHHILLFINIKIIH